MVLAAVLVVTALVQVCFLRMPMAKDAGRYAQWGRQLIDLDIEADYAHGQTRLGVLVPVHLAQRTLGVSELSYHLVPFLLHLLLVGATFAIGVRLFGQIVGVVASLLLGVSVLLMWSSQVLPDTSGTAWFALAVVLLLAGGDRVGNKRLLLLALGTAACGMAYLCRENIVVLAPLVLLLAWRQRWGRPEWTVAVMVAGLVLLVEALALWLLFGDPLTRLHALAAFGEGSELLERYGRNATVLTVLTRAPQSMLVYHQGFVLVVAALLAPVMAVVARRSERPAWQVVAVWILAFWAFMLWSGGLLDPQQPHARVAKLRYWIPVLPALCLAAAAFGWQLARAVSRRQHVPVMVVLTVGLLVPFLSDLRVFASDPTFRVMLRPTPRDDMRDWLAHGAGDVREISTESHIRALLPYYARPFAGGEPRWDGEVHQILDRDLRWSPVREVRGTLLLTREALELTSPDEQVRESMLPRSYQALLQRGTVDERWSQEDLLIAHLP